VQLLVLAQLQLVVLQQLLQLLLHVLVVLHAQLVVLVQELLLLLSLPSSSPSVAKSWISNVSASSSASSAVSWCPGMSSLPLQAGPREGRAGVVSRRQRAGGRACFPRQAPR
jgi:hypothetical protein